ncbi:MAG: 2-amino-4-hydroxy-6-hydroxymethyldihydropteridine diphosphokinase [Candidatus Pelagibacterales bacterium]|jgi:2-amino-4-hydroxy-6-hydroxymethyldihydropteridine diphosphokinase|tara:strand:+ start:2832 stop:3347 length:516 start_codon:yes stop_codon:yes gene_type:complete
MIYALGLGSNLPSRYGSQYLTLKKSIQRIRENNITVLRISKLYITQPMGMKGNNWFLNGAIIISTQLKPFNLLMTLKKIEREMGRTVYKINTARPCDLDILLTNKNTIFNNTHGTHTIIIPHQRMHERAFVLRPLMDICPNWNHPIFNKSIKSINLSQELAQKITVYRNNL